ncbi:MAG: response regulator transcription factor [Actinomycetota bacterium]|nr:response regulator transcription factor [Actinomycetota bacterium]
MIKILLFPDKSINADKIKKVLDKTDFNIHLIKNAAGISSFINDAKLFIFDFTGRKINDEENDDIINSLKNKDHKGIAKIAIIDSSSKNNIFKSGFEFDDFCFYDNIEKELYFRIKALLLRMNIYPPKNSIAVGELILNLDKYELSVNGTPIELTYKEFELLNLLLKNQNKVFTRKKLLSIIWEYDFYGGSRTIDVHIRRLRSKIPPPYNLMLKTVRSVGYMFTHSI